MDKLSAYLARARGAGGGLLGTQRNVKSTEGNPLPQPGVGTPWSAISTKGGLAQSWPRTLPSHNPSLETES